MGYRKQICYPYGVQKTLFFCMFGSEFTVINRAEIECFLHPCGQFHFLFFAVALTKLISNPVGTCSTRSKSSKKKSDLEMTTTVKKTYFELVKEAILALKDRTGSSAQAIKGFITEHNPKLDFQQVSLILPFFSTESLLLASFLSIFYEMP